MDVRTYFYDSITEKSIFLVLAFKYDLKNKAQSEAKYLVSGLAVTNRREVFTALTLNLLGRSNLIKANVLGLMMDLTFSCSLKKK